MGELAVDGSDGKRKRPFGVARPKKVTELIDKHKARNCPHLAWIRLNRRNRSHYYEHLRENGIPVNPELKSR